MRVALLSHNARYGDAIGRQVAAKAAFFRDRGADVRVYVECGRQLHPTLDPYALVVDDATPLNDIAADIRACDLAIVEFGHHYRLAEILPLLAGARVRTIFDYHGVTPPEFAAGNGEALRAGQRWRALAWFADEITVHSRFMKRELQEATGVPPTRITVAPLSMTPTVDSFSSPRFLQCRTGQAGAEFALFVGRVAPNKRLPILIEALARLREERPRLHVAIIGDDSGAYRSEAARCMSVARELGVAERIHFLGSVSDADLAGAYASADLFVMPSVHEGFCMPVIEAMEHGLPVIASRATALPETLAGAGLLFEPDDAVDLARQMRRALQPNADPAPRPKRLAVVAARYGVDVVGGAERSLQTIARSLAENGWEVEVFTTGPADSYSNDQGIRIWSFARDHVHPPSLAEAQRIGPTGVCDEEAARRFFELAPGSRKLIGQLQDRIAEFAAIITGPYCSRLAVQVVEAFPQKTVLVPCFHDEPLAKTKLVRDIFREIAGVLYHSPEERELAQIELGISHPNASVIGTALERATFSSERTASNRPYLLYAGRFCREKNLPLLLDWQRRYEADRPGRFEFHFIGEGGFPIPATLPWNNRGLLSEKEKSAAIASASAVIQLSCNESLSLVALEAWQHSVPVLAHRECAVLAGMIERANGGACAGTYEEFRERLDSLFEQPELWRQLGRQGRAMVRDEFESTEAFAQRIDGVLSNMATSLAEQMRRRGRERAGWFQSENWERFFSMQVDRILHLEPLAIEEKAVIRPRGGLTSFVLEPNTRKVSVEIENCGSAPLAPSLPGARVVWTVLSTLGGEAATPPSATRLPGWLLPGQVTSVFLRVKLSAVPGEYRLGLALRREDAPAPELHECDVEYLLLLEAKTPATADSAVLDRLRSALAEVEKLQDLPDGYSDVSTGPFAKFKQQIKERLLHQFKTAYVDVLSRQQSEWNRQVGLVLHELAESVALLERSAVAEQSSEKSSELSSLVARLRRGVRSAVTKIESLEERIERLEALVDQKSPARTQE